MDYKKRQQEKQKEKKPKTNPISKVSTKNTYRDSDGKRYSKSEIESKVKKAKAEKIQQFLDKHGYIFCEDCGKNTCKPVDCSHTISVDDAQSDGRTELAWFIPNIKLRGRECHNKHDKKPAIEREKIFRQGLKSNH